MVKASSDLMAAASDAAEGNSSPSTIVPLFPSLGGCWDFGSGGVAAEEEDEESPQDGLVVALRDVVGDTLEGHDPAGGLDKKPDVRQRRRTFHIV
jgi:hypothetical protein